MSNVSIREKLEFKVCHITLFATRQIDGLLLPTYFFTSLNQVSTPSKDPCAQRITRLLKMFKVVEN